MKKKLLMISWRDIKSPFAGGVEILTHNILKRLTNEYDITVLSSAFPHCALREEIDGLVYVRLGSKKFNYLGSHNWRIYFSVFKFFFHHVSKKSTHYDVVIEQINNVPFFYSLYGDSKTILFIHQLCRKNWFHHLPWYLAWFGYWIFEPLYLFLFRNKQVITVSNSTKNDLLKYGFKKNKISVISEAYNFSKKINFDKAAYQFYDAVISTQFEPQQTFLKLRRFRYAK